MGKVDDLSLYFRGSQRTMNSEIFAGIMRFKNGEYCISKCSFRRNSRFVSNQVSPKFENNSWTFTTGVFGRDRYSQFEFYEIQESPSLFIKSTDKVYKDYMNDKNRSSDTYNV
ncbi:MAG TPA: hypothetical protein PKD85_24020, partial [Saprospiraceae bacterium]|nr:hypothetical protein [Saprospiraceae bacterium]